MNEALCSKLRTSLRINDARCNVKKNEVLICNFGGPEKEADVQPFLYNLFYDPLVIKTPFGPFRKMFANYVSKRAPESNHEYAKIGYSPINKTTQTQADQLEKLLKQTHPDTTVRVINRYTAPFAEEVVPKVDVDDSRIFVLTMYPHFCHSTTATSVREVDRVFLELYPDREIDSTRIYSWWHNSSYLEYTYEQIRSRLEQTLTDNPEGPVSVMFSAHGLPKKYRIKGDPYVSETTGHFNEIKRRCGVWLETFDSGKHKDRCHWQLCYQSRVGPVEWTKPYTDSTIEELGKTRGGHLLLVPVSFTSDHIETLYEMDVTYKEQALKDGFSSYQRVLAANTDMKFTECLKDILLQHGF